MYFYTASQEQGLQLEKAAAQQKLGKRVVTEIQKVDTFYLAEANHQQFLEKGGRNGLAQSAIKGCCDRIRCYG
jgi:peptide-methionine (S)-S-oxide reductase